VIKNATSLPDGIEREFDGYARIGQNYRSKLVNLGKQNRDGLMENEMTERLRNEITKVIGK